MSWRKSISAAISSRFVDFQGYGDFEGAVIVGEAGARASSKPCLNLFEGGPVEIAEGEALFTDRFGRRGYQHSETTETILW